MNENSFVKKSYEKSIVQKNLSKPPSCITFYLFPQEEALHQLKYRQANSLLNPHSEITTLRISNIEFIHWLKLIFLSKKYFNLLLPCVQQ